jgi:hypothetical protein
MSSLNDVVMTEDTWQAIHTTKWHYRWWVVKFYAGHLGCLWRDLWWRFMPGEIIRFNSTVDWDRQDFEQWCWRNVGVKNISWGLRIDNWVKDEHYDFAIKVRKGKTKHLSHLALIVR